ncbi:MAG TPA: hypothetical protein VFH34_01290, partial [Anaerolineales bacterium]|nr:hypothetical protein [Anaerolineales bacterium]
NKRGQLSQSQKEWLKMVGKGGVRLQSFNVWIAIGFMFLGLCLILALFLQNEDTRAALIANPLNVWIFPILVVVVVSILALSLLLARWNANKLQNAALSSASGNVRFDRDSSGESGITTYYVIVGKKKFKFGDDVSETFKEGEKYKFYYCKAGFYEFVMSYERTQK